MPDATDNRTFRLKVKLVNADDETMELPVGGFVMIPEDRLRLFERISTSARDLLKAKKDTNVSIQMSGQAKAVDRLEKDVPDLEKIWDVPAYPVPPRT